MEKTKSLANLSNIVFVIAFVFSTSFLMCNPSLSGFFATSTSIALFLKVIISVVISAGATYFSFWANGNFHFMSLAGPVIIIIQTMVLTIDHYTSQFYGAEDENLALHVLFLIASISAYAATGSTINRQNSINSYPEFLKTFNISAAICYLFLIIVFLVKTPVRGSFTGELNTQLGNGVISAFKSFLITHDLSFAYSFFGNILFFAPLGYFVTYYLRKKEPVIPLVVGFAVICLIEVYQYTGNCGNVDVDELVLNSAGFFLGFAACKLL